MRINIYRKQINENDTKNGVKDTVSAGKVPGKCRESAGEVPINEQEQQIYKLIVERGFITTTESTALLGVKQRRARNILGKMVENKWLRKEGASRSTIYVINEKKR